MEDVRADRRLRAYRAECARAVKEALRARPRPDLDTDNYPASLETIPLFVRAGTVLPLGEIGPSVEQRPDKFLRLHVYPLTEDGESVSWLYEDAGEGFGAQRVSRFVMRRTGDRLEITWERTGDYRPPYEHIALTLNGLPRMPQAVLADGEPYRPVAGDPVLRTALVGLPPFEKLEIVL